MLRTRLRWLVLTGVAVGLAGLAPRVAVAQVPQMVRNWEPPFDFRPDGVWRRKVREVAAARAAALARGQFDLLNAPVRRGAPEPSAYAVGGTITVPALLMRYLDTDTTQQKGDSTAYTNVLFGASPPLSRPYTVRTFYEQLSGGLFSMRGKAIGWVPLSQPESLYAGPPHGCPSNTYTGHNCNGIFGSSIVSLHNGLVEAIHVADSLYHPDWSQFSYDAATGILELVIFVHPNMDGACVLSTNNHVWSHRYALSAIGGSAVATKTPWPGHVGQFLKIDDYTIQAGVGGGLACDTTQIMPIGTAAHETGHGLGFPDLYDTGTSSVGEGIGEWGLMSSGNYARPLSPAFFEAWSRTYVGWTTVRPLTTGGSYTLGPVEAGDTVFLIRPSGANPRDEYYLLENRQPLLSDSALLNKRNSPGGLLVWHVDSTQLYGAWNSNTVNAGPIHGLVLVEADGLDNLLSSSGTSNRGDNGDPFPGATIRTHLGGDAAEPNTALHAGGYAMFVLDSITQVTPNGAMRFRVNLGGALTVAASDTAAHVRVRGQLVSRYVLYVLPGNTDTATISMDTVQTSAAGTTQYRFVSWSDGGARTHLVTMTGRDTTITASVTRKFVLGWAVAGLGSVTASAGAPASGSFFTEGDTVGLTAHPAANAIFMGWSGDVTSAAPHLKLTAGQPYNVTANFTAAPLDSVVAMLLNAHGLTALQATTLDFQGNQNGHFDLGDFIAWLDQSGTAISAQLLARIFERVRP
jgi:M6 family metalloprotease-like protein